MEGLLFGTHQDTSVHKAVVIRIIFENKSSLSVHGWSMSSFSHNSTNLFCFTGIALYINILSIPVKAFAFVTPRFSTTKNGIKTLSPPRSWFFHLQSQFCFHLGSLDVVRMMALFSFRYTGILSPAISVKKVSLFPNRCGSSVVSSDWPCFSQMLLCY